MERCILVCICCMWYVMYGMTNLYNIVHMKVTVHFRQCAWWWWGGIWSYYIYTAIRYSQCVQGHECSWLHPWGVSDLMVGCMVVGSCMHALPTVYMTVETCLLRVTCTNLNALCRLQLQLWLTPVATSIIKKW